MSVRSHHHDDSEIIDEDSLSPFIINTVTRVISTTNKKMVLMQYDNKSERYTFEVDRKIDNHDLLDCNRIQIHFINISSTKQKHPGLYLVDDLEVMESDENKVTFTWLVSHDATQYAGILSFLVSFEYVEGDKVLYRWSSSIYNSIQIATGMDNDNCIVETYADELLAWQNSMETDVIPKMVDKRYIEREFATSEEVASVFDISNPDASSKVAVVPIKEITDYVDNAIAGIEPTSNVTANPTLDGTESDLTGLQVGETKYKIPEQKNITIDAELSTTSENAVQNKVITAKLNEIDNKVVDKDDIQNMLVSSLEQTETWILPQKLPLSTGDAETSLTWNVGFTSNGIHFDRLYEYCRWWDGISLSYGDTRVFYINAAPTPSEYIWENQAYRTIVFDKPVTDTSLKNWLQNHGAVKQGDTGAPNKTSGEIGTIKEYYTKLDFYPKTFIEAVYDENGKPLNTLMPVANPELDGTEDDLTGLTVNGTKYKLPMGGEYSAGNGLKLTDKEFSIDQDIVVQQTDLNKVLLSSTATEEVWVFPNNLKGFSGYGTSPTFEVNFISNKTKFSKIVVDRKYNDTHHLFYDSTTICTIHAIYQRFDWLGDGYKTIALETPATGELLAFLQSAGAVKQGENGTPSKNTGDVGIIKQKTNDNFYPKTFVDCIYDDNGNSLNTLMPVANPTLDGTEADLDSLTINGTKYKIPAQSQTTIDDTLSTTSENAIQNKIVTNEINNIKTKLDNITVENNITTEDYVIEGQI